MSDSPADANPPPEAAAPSKVSAPTRMGWFIRDAKTLRMKAKLSLNKLAVLADVSRDTLSSVESGHSVNELNAEKIFEALNHSAGGALPKENYVHSGPVRKRNKVVKSN